MTCSDKKVMFRTSYRYGTLSLWANAPAKEHSFNF